MIIFFVWYSLFFSSLMHSFCKISSSFIFWWIFILIILPFLRNHNTIIPKIITNCVSIFIFYIWIKLILFTWNNTLHCQLHSFSLTTLISFRIIIIFLISILYLLFFNFLFFIFLFNFLLFNFFFLFFTFPIIWYIYLFLF